MFRAAGYGPRPAGDSGPELDQARSPQPATCRPGNSQTQRLELLQHLGDAAADDLALVAQGRELHTGSLGLRETRLRHFQLTRETLVLLRQPGLVSAESFDHAD